MKKEISNEDKKYFVCFYLKEQKEYLKLRKIKKIATIICLSVTALSGVLAFISFPIAYVLFTLCGTVAIPTFFNISFKMHDVIDKARIGNITYRVFKKMFKSGELQTLIDEYNKFLAEPVKVGIQKFNEDEVKIEKQTPVHKELCYVKQSEKNDLEK